MAAVMDEMRAVLVLELREVQTGHDLVHRSGVIVGGQHQRHDRPRGRPGHTVEAIWLRRGDQRCDGADQAGSLDAASLQNQVSVGHVQSPLTAERSRVIAAATNAATVTSTARPATRLLFLIWL